MYATRAGAGGGAPLISSRSGSFHSARHPVGSRGVDVSAASAALLPQPPPAVRGARLPRPFLCLSPSPLLSLLRRLWHCARLWLWGVRTPGVNRGTARGQRRRTHACLAPSCPFFVVYARALRCRTEADGAEHVAAHVLFLRHFCNSTAAAPAVRPPLLLCTLPPRQGGASLVRCRTPGFNRGHAASSAQSRGTARERGAPGARVCRLLASRIIALSSAASVGRKTRRRW